ncbi:MAG: ABC transporter ATP-binding protein [Desulfovibrionaceae bacterium]|jgi:branched-chain amino acid transport system ATP-binding protein|nr:ABC transporter ATP-binding protein [Desulfovibrionaceae bacterium]
MQSSDEPANSAQLLRLQGVTVRFGGILALDNVSFTVRRGQICGLIGPNGAGKSTLFNCLSRLYTCDSGSIWLEGQAVTNMPRHRMAAMGIGRTFQNLALFSRMTVRENVLIGCHIRHHLGFVRSALRIAGARQREAAAQAKAQELLDWLDLTPHADKLTSDLPFGTQKRVELARALATQPKLLLLDEPACGLNHEELQSLGELIRGIRERLNLTVLLVEHNMGLVMGVSDHVVALNFGRKIAEGTPAEVRAHPEVIRAYLGAETGEALT